MTRNRRQPSLSTKKQILHEAGYKCSNPTCRTILTIDIHHLEHVSDEGSNEPDNLLALCPNCHALHHRGVISNESLRTWKMLLLSLNQAFNRESIDLLLALGKLDRILVHGEGVLSCAALIASDLVKVIKETSQYPGHDLPLDERYFVQLSEKGRRFVQAWRDGDQKTAISLDEVPSDQTSE